MATESKGRGGVGAEGEVRGSDGRDAVLAGASRPLVEVVGDVVVLCVCVGGSECVCV